MLKPVTMFDGNGSGMLGPCSGRAQASAVDYFRYEFFGPAQGAACGDVNGLRLLDVGCGSGYFAHGARGAHVTAVDLSPRMIDHAQRIEALRPLGIEYRVGDAAEIEATFAHASFDIATSCVALTDMPEAAKALNAVRSVLRAGGRFVASILHPCTDTPYRVWESDETGRKRWLRIDRYVDKRPA
jgi:SAM-dependent methyltransferase